MRVQNILAHKGTAVATVQPDVPVAEVIALLNGRGIGALVVSSDGRTIAGIEPGRQLRATGRITSGEGRRLIYNPRYELLAPESVDSG